MSLTQDLKQQLVREAVDDNLSNLEGRRASGPREEARRPSSAAIAANPRRPRSSWWLAAVLPILVGFVVIVAGKLPGVDELVASSPTPTPEGSTPAVSAAVEDEAVERIAEDRVFGAPKPIETDIFPLALRRVVLDPGHGGDDLGTVSAGLSEKDLTLDIAMRLKKRLEDASYEVLLTRHTDRPVSLRERAQFANSQRADAFVSIHINWISARRVRGVETYFLGPTEDPELAALARRENRESGYSLGDLKQLLEGIYADVRQDESRQLASRIQRSLFHSLRQVNPQLKDRGVKTAPFVVLVATDMPAILAEVSCLSNQEEAELLSRPLYREHIAEALFRGVEGFARDVNQIEEKGADS